MIHKANERKKSKHLRLQVTVRMNSLTTRSLAKEYHYLIVSRDTPRKKIVKLSKGFKPKEEVRTQVLREPGER